MGKVLATNHLQSLCFGFTNYTGKTCNDSRGWGWFFLRISWQIEVLIMACHSMDAKLIKASCLFQIIFHEFHPHITCLQLKNQQYATVICRRHPQINLYSKLKIRIGQYIIDKHLAFHDTVLNSNFTIQNHVHLLFPPFSMERNRVHNSEQEDERQTLKGWRVNNCLNWQCSFHKVRMYSKSYLSKQEHVRRG